MGFVISYGIPAVNSRATLASNFYKNLRFTKKNTRITLQAFKAWMELVMLTDLDEWRELTCHNQVMDSFDLKEEIKSNPQRLPSLSFTISGINIDCSRNNISYNTINLLHRLATTRKIPAYIKSLFTCENINTTEQQPALHAALRSPELFNNQSVIDNVTTSTTKIGALAQAIRNGDFLTTANKPIKHLVNIGIGGSDLGPRMVSHALQHLPHQIQCHFVSNLDPFAISSTLSNLNPDETLLLIVSKSFTSLETLTNARFAMSWMGNRRIGKQCIAITEHHEKALSFGISKANILPMWRWTGGRYSLWSTVGLSIAIQYGMSEFQALLTGANNIDQHVAKNPLKNNIPLLLALVDIWHVNFLNCSSQAIIPYIEKAKHLPNYLQQLIMESNGKSINNQHQPINYATCPVIWGGIGSDSQHAFHQLFMQGTAQIPIDFIYQTQADIPELQPQQNLLTNLVHAQSDALLFGNTRTETNPHKHVAGNRSHTLYSFKKLDAMTLGALIALYEYRTIFAAAIWDINPFDQFGVELGKRLTKKPSIKRQSQHEIS